MKTKHVHSARPYAEALLELARRYPQPRQQALMVDFMLDFRGLDLAYTVRVRRHGAFADLASLEQRLVELGEPVAKGGGDE